MSIELITRYVKILIAFALVWAGLWAFNNYGCSRVEGPEMQPAIPADKSALIDPKVRRADQLSREDVVCFEYDIDGRGVTRRVTARVVGLPGDRVKMVKGDVFVEGEKISVYSDKKSVPDDLPELIVPKDSVFVLCDNRGQSKSLDSRRLGPIGCWALTGKLR
jgi:signal peptidase I